MGWVTAFGRWGGSSSLLLAMEYQVWGTMLRAGAVWSTHLLLTYGSEHLFFLFFLIPFSNFAPSSAVGEESSKRGVPTSPPALRSIDSIGIVCLSIYTLL